MTRLSRLGFVCVTTLLPFWMSLSYGADDSVTLRRDGLGDQVANFQLPDLEGNPIALYDFAGKRAAVLVFIGSECPVGNLLMPRLNELADRYRERGVVFLAINSNANESAVQIGAHAEEYQVGFPVLLDPDQTVADQFQVERTCETLVVDGRAVLRYRGAIDNQYTYRARRPEPSKTYLVDALEAILDQQPVEVDATPVFGCPIMRGEALDAEPDPITEAVEADNALERALAEVGEVNYSRDVAAILQNKCQTCHRPGQIGPFALMDYRDARRWAASIAEVVEDDRMPPWDADPAHGTFANARSLSPQEKATLIAWYEQGFTEGDPTDLPAPRVYPSETWTLGTPDAIVQLPEPIAIQAQGTMPYQYVRVPTGFTEDTWIRAYEVLPNAREAVHHILIFVAPPGERGPGSLLDGQLAGYVPGDEATAFPDGMGKRIPAGSSLIFQLHYTPIGKPLTDQSAIGLYFADGPVEQSVVTQGITPRRSDDSTRTSLVIPPRAANHEVAASITVRDDMTLLSLWPHMHLRGKDFLFRLITPDGRRQTLLSVPEYDFNWQTTYVLDEPLQVVKGSVIECVAHYDNSASNPYNPDPDARVTWGEQTTDEMMIGYIDFVYDAGRPARNPIVDRIFGQLDVDADGIISRKELPQRIRFEDVDTDGNGEVDFDETEAYLRARFGR